MPGSSMQYMQKPLLQPNTNRVLDSFTSRAPPPPPVTSKTIQAQPDIVPADVRTKMVVLEHGLGKSGLVTTRNVFPATPC